MHTGARIGHACPHVTQPSLVSDQPFLTISHQQQGGPHLRCVAVGWVIAHQVGEQHVPMTHAHPMLPGIQRSGLLLPLPPARQPARPPSMLPTSPSACSPSVYAGSTVRRVEDVLPRRAMQAAAQARQQEQPRVLAPSPKTWYQVSSSSSSSSRLESTLCEGSMETKMSMSAPPPTPSTPPSSLQLPAPPRTFSSLPPTHPPPPARMVSPYHLTPLLNPPPQPAWGPPYHLSPLLIHPPQPAWGPPHHLSSSLLPC